MELFVKNLLAVTQRFNIDEAALRGAFREKRNMLRLLEGKPSRISQPTIDAVDKFFETRGINVSAASLKSADFDAENFAPQTGFGVIESLFRRTSRAGEQKIAQLLGGRESMHYYVISEGRRGFDRGASPFEQARCYVRDMRMFRAGTGDLFAFEMNRDFRASLPLTAAERASDHAHSLLSGYLTLLHSTLIMLGACPRADDIEPIMFQCFMGSLTPYCFFGSQHGGFQVHKQFYARRVAFVQGLRYNPNRLGIKNWDQIDERLQRWLIAKEALNTYALFDAPPASIFSIGADSDFKF